MPNVLLPVPHFEQRRDGYCLPACVRMILAYFGEEHTEDELVQLLKTKAYGTPISNAKRLMPGPYQVEVEPLTKPILKSYLDDNQPVICRVWTVMLDYWDVTTSHVVVVIGYDETSVFLNDPAFSDAPKTVSWDAFLVTWAEYDETAVVIASV